MSSLLLLSIIYYKYNKIEGAAKFATTAMASWLGAGMGYLGGDGRSNLEGWSFLHQNMPLNPGILDLLSPMLQLFPFQQEIAF